jgi:hypothetical protein
MMLIEDYLAGPQLLRKAVAGMSQDQLVARPIPGTWSTLEVICHWLTSRSSVPTGSSE